MKWEKVKLGDCCEITSSKRIYYSEYVESGIPFFRSKEIIELSSGSPISEPLYISQAKYETIKEKYGIPKPGDMLLTSVGTIGVPYIVKSSDCFYFKDGNLTWFRNFKENLLPSFLYHWVKSQEGYGKLYNATIGSSQKALTISALNNLEISLPPLPIQKKIAFVLSCYDDLIENCRKQIALLQEAAARVYRKWFVGKGEKAGWTRGTVGEIASFKRGKTITKSQVHKGSVPVVAGGKEPAYYHDKANTTSPVITVSASGNAGFVRLYYQDIWASDCSFLDASETDNLFFIYSFLKYRQDDLYAMQKGSCQQHVNAKDINTMELLIPPDTFLKDFAKLATPIFDKIATLQHQISLLAAARDLCLPRLMSGRGSDGER